MLSTKEELYLYLEKISRGYALKDLKYFTANHISESLNISRNLASQYLNELVKEERAIKVNSRPVYFFHKKNVEREAQVTLETCVFSGMDDFQRKCRSDEKKRDFQKAIGYYLSLGSCIEQCKAAIKYPPNGLPALFNGAGGTGKAFLSGLMYEYAVNERVLGTAGAASLPPYITVDCSEYAQNEEKFAISLCGSEEGKGWLAKANGGILFFDEIDRLPFSGQELIYSYLISGQYFQIMLDVFEDYRQDMLSFDGLMMEFRKQLNDYYDYLIYGQKLVNIKISTYEQLINQIFENVGEMYGISLSKKYSHLLARRLYIQLQGDHLIDNWMKQNHDEIEEMFQAVSAVLEKEAVICYRIVNLIKLNLDIEADSLNQLFLLLDIKNQNQKIQGLSAAGIILSHGYATASSIADAANQIIGRKVFDAIDMPLDMQMSDITGLLEKHIERFITCQDVVLLVDMGSLEQIHSQMGGLRNLNIGIINNISTALAVDIGLGICGNQKLEDILKRASESNVCTYRIIHNVQKEDAVIFSGENGIDTTEKLKELILKTSATSIPVKFVAYDYYRLMKNGSHDEIFQQYHVKCIIGLFNPEIEGIPFISLEDIISMNSAEKLTNIFSEYLDEEQMEVFNQNLVKNFSLQNVVESITILNPDKLLDEVEQAVGRLQKITGRKIAGRIMIGLYVHLCCLVERLVTKTPIDNYQDLEEFEQKHADFIRQVRDSFQDISRHYRVALPVSEIAYIYDYMHLNSKNKLSGQAESPAVREDE